MLISSVLRLTASATFGSAVHIAQEHPKRMTLSSLLKEQPAHCWYLCTRLKRISNHLKIFWNIPKHANLSLSSMPLCLSFIQRSFLYSCCPWIAVGLKSSWCYGWYLIFDIFKHSHGKRWYISRSWAEGCRIMESSRHQLEFLDAPLVCSTYIFDVLPTAVVDIWQSWSSSGQYSSPTVEGSVSQDHSTNHFH